MCIAASTVASIFFQMFGFVHNGFFGRYAAFVNFDRLLALGNSGGIESFKVIHFHPGIYIVRYAEECFRSQIQHREAEMLTSLHIKDDDRFTD